jgi:hypothetical protein
MSNAPAILTAAPGQREILRLALADAALIYQHEARGADQAITNAIDSHVQAEQSSDEDDDGQAGTLAPVG